MIETKQNMAEEKAIHLVLQEEPNNYSTERRPNGNKKIEILKGTATLEFILENFHKDPKVMLGLFAAGLAATLVQSVYQVLSDPDFQTKINKETETTERITAEAKIGGIVYQAIHDLKKSGAWFLISAELSLNLVAYPPELKDIITGATGSILATGKQAAEGVATAALEHPEVTKVVAAVVSIFAANSLTNKAKLPKKLFQRRKKAQKIITESFNKLKSWAGQYRIVSPLEVQVRIQPPLQKKMK